MQSTADAEYFTNVASRRLGTEELQRVKAVVLEAYRWQYIISGVAVPRFQEQLGGKLTPEQQERVSQALAPIMSAA